MTFTIYGQRMHTIATVTAIDREIAALLAHALYGADVAVVGAR